jgi:hypothetical protein
MPDTRVYTPWAVGHVTAARCGLPPAVAMPRLRLLPLGALMGLKARRGGPTRPPAVGFARPTEARASRPYQRRRPTKVGPAGPKANVYGGPGRGHNLRPRYAPPATRGVWPTPQPRHKHLGPSNRIRGPTMPAVCGSAPPGPRSPDCGPRPRYGVPHHKRYSAAPNNPLAGGGGPFTWALGGFGPLAPPGARSRG